MGLYFLPGTITFSTAGCSTETNLVMAVLPPCDLKEDRSIVDLAEVLLVDHPVLCNQEVCEHPLYKACHCGQDKANVSPA